MYKSLVYLLIFTMVIISLGHILVAYVNPETYFFGIKLGGKPATIYLLTKSSIGIAITYLLLKSLKAGVIISLLYFGYNFIESVATSLILYYKFSLPVIPVFGLILSALILLSRKYREIKVE